MKILIILITIILCLLLCLVFFFIKSKKYINNEIKLQYIPNLLSDNECDHLINLADNKFFRSSVLVNAESIEESTRTSSTYYYQKSQDDIIKNIENKVAQMLNISVKQIEPLQIVKYEPGQEFKAHYDWFYDDFKKSINNDQRQYTIFAYLNNVDKGGETAFPNLNLKFKPKKGDAVFWENCTDPITCSTLNLHQGSPPESGIKYGLNIWTRFYESY